MRTKRNVAPEPAKIAVPPATLGELMSKLALFAADLNDKVARPFDLRINVITSTIPRIEGKFEVATSTSERNTVLVTVDSPEWTGAPWTMELKLDASSMLNVPFTFLDEFVEGSKELSALAELLNATFKDHFVKVAQPNAE